MTDLVKVVLWLLQPEFLTSANEVRHFLTLMEKACSPLKKLENLLGAMTTLNTSVRCCFIVISRLCSEAQMGSQWGSGHCRLSLPFDPYLSSTDSSATYFANLAQDKFLGHPTHRRVTAESITLSRFHSCLKTFLFQKSFPP